MAVQYALHTLLWHYRTAVVCKRMRFIKEAIGFIDGAADAKEKIPRISAMTNLSIISWILAAFRNNACIATSPNFTKHFQSHSFYTTLRWHIH